MGGSRTGGEDTVVMFVIEPFLPPRHQFPGEGLDEGDIRAFGEGDLGCVVVLFFGALGGRQSVGDLPFGEAYDFPGFESMLVSNLLIFFLFPLMARSRGTGRPQGRNRRGWGACGGETGR